MTKIAIYLNMFNLQGGRIYNMAASIAVFDLLNISVYIIYDYDKSWNRLDNFLLEGGRGVIPTWKYNLKS